MIITIFFFEVEITTYLIYTVNQDLDIYYKWDYETSNSYADIASLFGSFGYILKIDVGG